MENRDYSPIYRVMHWAIAICMILILITIFLRLTWLYKENVADIIQNYLAANDMSLTRDQLIVLAKQIRKPMWDWHIYLGYALTGLFSIRLLLPFFGYMKFANPLDKSLNAKAKFQYWLYIIFYVCVVASLVTGLVIEWGPRSIKANVEEIHKLSIYYLVTYIVLHLGGVFLAEFGKQRGIISRVISGRKPS
jgi:cytochrome b561